MEEETPEGTSGLVGTVLVVMAIGFAMVAVIAVTVAAAAVVVAAVVARALAVDLGEHLGEICCCGVNSGSALARVAIVEATAMASCVASS